MTEGEYQAELIRTLRRLFPGCIILKNDSDYIQGIPDLLILWGDTWAALEVKASRNTPNRANQEYYVRQMADMSFAEFIYPEIEQEVLRALQRSFRPRRPSRIS